MAEDLSPSARRVQDALSALGFAFEVKEFPQTTRTAPEAAAAIGCKVEQIAKSLVFRGRVTQKPVLIITSGANRVNEKLIGTLRAEAIDRADADYVRQHTGFAIGGVPPVGHTEELEVLIDEDLLKHEEIWAAAGTPNSVFRLDPVMLSTMTSGRVVSVK